MAAQADGTQRRQALLIATSDYNDPPCDSSALLGVTPATWRMLWARLEAEQAERRKAEEQARLEAEHAERRKAEEQARRSATDKVNGFDRALVAIGYLLPIVALIAAFRRNSFIRINAILALMLFAIGSVIPFVTIGPSYHDTARNGLVPISEPWFGILDTVGFAALSVAAILILYCLFRVVREGRMPRIVLLTPTASRLVSHNPRRSTMKSPDAR